MILTTSTSAFSTRCLPVLLSGGYANVRSATTTHHDSHCRCLYLADATCAFKLKLPPPDGAVGHTSLPLDGVLIAPSFEQRLHARALYLAVCFACSNTSI